MGHRTPKDRNTRGAPAERCRPRPRIPSCGGTGDCQNNPSVETPRKMIGVAASNVTPGSHFQRDDHHCTPRRHESPPLRTPTTFSKYGTGFIQKKLLRNHTTSTSIGGPHHDARNDDWRSPSRRLAVPITTLTLITTRATKHLAATSKEMTTTVHHPSTNPHPSEHQQHSQNTGPDSSKKNSYATTSTSIGGPHFLVVHETASRSGTESDGMYNLGELLEKS